MYTSYTYIQFQKKRLELVSKRCCPFDPPSKSPTSFNTTQMGASHASSSIENHVASVVVKSQLWKTPQHQAIRTFPKPGKLGDDDSESSRWKFPELPMESLLFPQEWGLETSHIFLFNDVHRKKSWFCLIMRNFEWHPFGPSLILGPSKLPFAA